MELNTKLILFIQNMLKQINKKFIYFKVYFGTGIFFLFLGFLIGNLFGSFLNIFHESFIWQGFITILIILFIELMNYLRYHNNIKIVNFFKFLTILVNSTIFKTFYFINKQKVKQKKKNFCKKLKFI